MKKVRALILITFLFIFMPQIVKADCSYAEQNKLNGLVNQVTTNFDLKKGTREVTDYYEDQLLTVTVPTYEFFGSIYGITADFYVIVQDANKGITTYQYSDALEGVITFKDLDPYKINEYTMEIYSVSSHACGEKKLRTMKLTIPMINKFHNLDICSEAKDYYLCDEYTTVEMKYNDLEFATKVQDYIDRKAKEKENDEKNKKDGFWQQIGNFIKDNKYFFIIGGAVVIIAVPTTIVVVRRRRII